jgi:hypothetical protein
MKNKAVDNGTTRKLNQPTENADEKKQLPITPSNDAANLFDESRYEFFLLCEV